MKLSAESIANLDNLVHTAIIADIRKIVIEKDLIRGIDEKQSVVVIAKDKVPDFAGKVVGFNRIDQLDSRISLIKAQGTMEIDATEIKDSISILDLHCGKTKAQYRCASDEVHRKGIPKQLVDNLVWEFKINQKELQMITQGVQAMKSEGITFASKNGKTVSVEIVDSCKDMFNMDIQSSVEYKGTDSGTSFCRTYPQKTFISLAREALKNSEIIDIKIGEGGILSFKVNGLDFFVIQI